MDITSKIFNRNGGTQTEGLGLFTRPWGFYRNIHISPVSKVKILHINPGQQLSLQYHKKRFENWVVEKGEIVVITRQQGSSTLVHQEGKVGGYFDIPPYLIHRISNQKDYPAEVLELQWGDECLEEDIVRISDIYGRS